jgi:hypothetical protein
MTGGTSVAKSSAGPTFSVRIAPASRSVSAPTTSSRSASASTITTFLPPISATTFLMWN